jgi:signal peptide peptidase SppA
MSRSYAHVLSLVFERPWAILPSTLATIVEVVRLRAIGTPLTAEDVRERLAASPQRQRRAATGAVAVIPVHGVIVPKANLMTEMSGATSVESLTGAFRDAMAAEDVSGVVFDIDSPGGVVEGLPELAAEIRGARGAKPVVAVANHMAASAAYWLGSQADELVASPSASVGAIGVYMAHMDESAAFEKEGIKPTVVSAGRYKQEGLPYAPLTDDAKAHLQSIVDDYYGMFTSDVSKGRRVPIATVRDGYGEGRMFTAQTALREGMVDRVDTLDNSIVRVARGRVGSVSQTTQVDGFASFTTTVSFGDSFIAGPVAPHGTATSDGAWDGAANEARLPTPVPVATARAAYAWIDDAAVNNGEVPKSGARFLHHEVGGDGRPGPANITACRTGIGVLNGGRGGTTIPADDKRGVYDHLARHLRDANLTPPDFNGQASSDANELEVRKLRARAHARVR